MVDLVLEAEKLGVDAAWSAEAWGQDGVAPLAFLAAKTSRIKLGTGILQISARTPSMTAMTALTMAALSDDRFILGLGASGPQVVEGLQGVPFKAPLSRMRETVEIIKLAFAGEKLSYSGRFHKLPLPGGEGKALRLAQPGNANIPIYLATLGPNSLVYTGEVADGWLGTSFTPEHAGAHLDYLQEGLKKSDRKLTDLDIQAGGMVAFGDDLDALVAPLKPGIAFQMGAMGSAKTNFYNDAFKRGGFEAAAGEIQRLWVNGQREAAVEAVPADMVVAANLLGDEAMVLERMRAYRDAGVSTLRLQPAGNGMAEQLETLGRAMDLVKSL